MFFYEEDLGFVQESMFYFFFQAKRLDLNRFLYDVRIHSFAIMRALSV